MKERPLTAVRDTIVKEFEIIRLLRERNPPGAGVRTGIGDDCAVLSAPGGGTFVVTTDMLLEGTHFTGSDRPADVGYKALAVSISDVAAMGCRSSFAFLAVGLPGGASAALAQGLLDGVLDAARAFEVSLAGGDTTESRVGMSLCSTVIGFPEPGRAPILRSGAAAGEVVAVTGSLGGSLASGRHLRFVPRQREALELVGRCRVGAMIDLSDGLSSDAGHLAAESGVCCRLFADRIPVSPDARVAAPLDAALNDGEDFELLFTVSRDDGERLSRSGLAGTPVTVIGEIVPGQGTVTLVDARGNEKALSAGGYEHFSG